MRYQFTKADRIRKPSEYRRVAKQGIRDHSECFIIVSRENHIQRSRLGITVSKKVGKAVKRNKIKRIIRETFRLNRRLLPESLDINIIARPLAAKVRPASLRYHLLQRLGKIEAPLKKG